jgi:hypothetical protein
MSLTYEPSSEPLVITAKQLFFNREQDLCAEEKQLLNPRVVHPLTASAAVLARSAACFPPYTFGFEGLGMKG